MAKIDQNSRPAIINSMKAAAWVTDIKRRANIESDRALLLVVPTLKGMKVRFGRYLSGIHLPSPKIQNAVHEYPPVKNSRLVYEFGPEENGDFVPLWMLFQDRYDEFWVVIEDVVQLNGAGGEAEHIGRVDSVAHFFFPPDTWQDIRKNRRYSFELMNQIPAYMESSQIKPELKFLAAAIALWRLSMLVREGEEATEYLLHGLLSGPYVKVLEIHGIYEHVCRLVHALAVRHYLMLGNTDIASKVFSGVYQPTEKNQVDRNVSQSSVESDAKTIWSVWRGL
ncbi:hypothetical protein AAKU67_004088 [Oxalobacteraceae bacterium GrIS 2.11]